MKTLFGRRSGMAVVALIPVLVLGIDALPSTGTDAARPIVVRPSDLPRGSASDVPWLVDNVVHTAAGRTIKLPWSRAGARSHSLRLLGRTNHGWVVKSFSGGFEWKLWLARDGERHLVRATGVSEGEVVDYRVSDDHRRLLVHLFDGDRSTTVSVLDLAGTTLDSQDFDGTGEILDFSGPQVIVGTSETQRWDVDAHSVEPVGGDAAGADVARDLLFATDANSGESGPTSLDLPGVPPWTAALIQPVVSPDGRRVLSRDERGGDLITVRKLSTGAALANFDVRYLASETPRWENDRSFVFVAAINGVGDREALVRCRLSGRCQRISAIMLRDRISLPPL